jgi:hypothetical protein
LLPNITTGERVTFRFKVADVRTIPEKRQYRWQIAAGTWPAGGFTNNWRELGRETPLDWTTNKAGAYTFAVQYIDRDLNRSPTTVVPLTVVPPWYLNAKIVAPAALANFGLVGWAVLARSLYVRKRREAARLREELL